MSDVVLVHGTTQNAAGFWRLADALRQRGHRALTVDVPSGLPTAQVYADVLAAQLPADVCAPVVAAHSAAGLFLPALATRIEAVHQVWIAAVVHDHAGQTSLLDQARGDPGALFHPEWIGVDPATDPELAVRFLFHDVAEPATVAAALATVATTDLSTLYAEQPSLDPAACPSTYLQPTGDRTLTQPAMETMARRLGVQSVLVPGGHNAYVATPSPSPRPSTPPPGHPEAVVDAPVGTLHHIEVWVLDLGASEPGWAWLLGRLGYHRDRTWTGGASYRAGATYIVIEQSPDVAGEHQRRRAGVNHLAFHAGTPGDVDAIVAEAGEHGWHLLFPQAHPHAGGPEHCAAFLEDAAGYEVELVAR